MTIKNSLKKTARSVLIQIPPLWNFLYKTRYNMQKNQARVWVKERREKEAPLNINIGSCGDQYKGWLDTEETYLNLLKEHTWVNLFDRTDSVDAMLAEHVWEHLSWEDGITSAKMCFKYLKPGGYLRVAVPDGLTPIPEYVDAVRVGGVGPAADGHLMLYTYKTFKEVFELAGFEVRLLEYHDEAGEFHYNKWNLEEGVIRRSRYGRAGGQGPFDYSIVLDAIKKN